MHFSASTVASSVRLSLWDATEVHPRQANPALPLAADQALALRLFAP
jgi:hypothetical protein